MAGSQQACRGGHVSRPQQTCLRPPPWGRACFVASVAACREGRPQKPSASGARALSAAQPDSACSERRAPCGSSMGRRGSYRQGSHQAWPAGLLTPTRLPLRPGLALGRCQMLKVSPPPGSSVPLVSLNPGPQVAQKPSLLKFLPVRGVRLGGRGVSTWSPASLGQ